MKFISQVRKLGYITRLSAKSLVKLIQELPKDQQPELWDRTQLMEITHEGKRYVIARSKTISRFVLSFTGDRIECAIMCEFVFWPIGSAPDSHNNGALKEKMARRLAYCDSCKPFELELFASKTRLLATR